MRSERASARQDLSPLFAALGDQTRLRLLDRLCDEGPSSITRLSAGLAVTRQSVSKHLCVMEAAGLVSAQKQGREQIFHLETRRLAVARAQLDQLSRQWDRRLERLRDLVEDEPPRSAER
jgi:DNA-binding transcriptional ArsR family regulator